MWKVWPRFPVLPGVCGAALAGVLNLLQPPGGSTVWPKCFWYCRQYKHFIIKRLDADKRARVQRAAECRANIAIARQMRNNAPDARSEIPDPSICTDPGSQRALLCTALIYGFLMPGPNNAWLFPHAVKLIWSICWPPTGSHPLASSPAAPGSFLFPSAAGKCTSATGSPAEWFPGNFRAAVKWPHPRSNTKERTRQSVNPNTVSRRSLEPGAGRGRKAI